MSMVYHSLLVILGISGPSVVPSPSGLIAKAAVLHSASENRHLGLVLFYATYLFGKYGCKLCFYILKKGFI